MAVGLDVDTASDGEQVLLAAADKQYAIMILDWQMPRLTGLQVARKLREQDNYADVPLLALTANVFPKDVQACLDAGMNDHVAKPLEFDVLYDTLLRWLRGDESGS